jgi:hypothetical protein
VRLGPCSGSKWQLATNGLVGLVGSVGGGNAGLTQNDTSTRFSTGLIASAVACSMISVRVSTSTVSN